MVSNIFIITILFYISKYNQPLNIFNLPYLDGWKEEKKKFCPFCNSTYDTMAEAKSACEDDQNGNVVYDLFCDNVGYFCICPLTAVLTQTHPRGIDCIYVKND